MESPKGDKLYYEKEIVLMNDLKENREPTFAKLYLKDSFLVAMASKNRYFRVFGYIIRHMSYGNEFDHSVKEIAKAVGISVDTTRRILADLVQCDFLRKIPDSTRYMINPACIARGRYPHKAELQKNFDVLIASQK